MKTTRGKFRYTKMQIVLVCEMLAWAWRDRELLQTRRLRDWLRRAWWFSFRNKGPTKLTDEPNETHALMLPEGSHRVEVVKSTYVYQRAKYLNVPLLRDLCPREEVTVKFMFVTCGHFRGSGPLLGDFVYFNRYGVDEFYVHAEFHRHQDIPRVLEEIKRDVTRRRRLLNPYTPNWVPANPADTK